jgi:hypothetical protein
MYYKLSLKNPQKCKAVRNSQFLLHLISGLGFLLLDDFRSTTFHKRKISNKPLGVKPRSQSHHEAEAEREMAKGNWRIKTKRWGFPLQGSGNSRPLLYLCKSNRSWSPAHQGQLCVRAVVAAEETQGNLQFHRLTFCKILQWIRI